MQTALEQNAQVDHTPGPWVTEVNGPVVLIWSTAKSQHTGDEGDDRHVASMTGRSHVEAADARLIAAAPDMLAALKGIERCVSIDDSWLAPVRAAIARATLPAP